MTWAADPDQLSHPIGRWIAEHYSALPDNPKRLPLRCMRETARIYRVEPAPRCHDASRLYTS